MLKNDRAGLGLVNVEEFDDFKIKALRIDLQQVDLINLIIGDYL